MHDSSAIAYVIDPTLFETKHVYVDVDHHSEHHHGQDRPRLARAAREGAECQCRVDVDSERFLELYRRRLSEVQA